jgi:hypothetical protein
MEGLSRSALREQMPEKELLMEFDQIIGHFVRANDSELSAVALLNWIVVFIGAVATVLFAILHWLLKKWIFRKARCQKPDVGE